MNFSNLTLASPVNKNKKSESNIDYKRQHSRAAAGEEMQWDDAKGNPTKHLYGAFAFIHNKSKAEIHMVTDIISCSSLTTDMLAKRLNPERNIVKLSSRLLTIDWDTWLSLGTPKCFFGTTRVIAAHDKLSTYLEEQLGDLQYCEETGEIFL